MFLCDPTVGVIFGYLATVLPLQPIKKPAFIHSLQSFLPLRESNLVLQKILLSPSSGSAMDICWALHQLLSMLGKNKRFTLNFLCLLSFVSEFMSLGRIKYHCCWVHEMNNGRLILYTVIKWKKSIRSQHNFCQFLFFRVHKHYNTFNSFIQTHARPARQF